MKRIVLLPSNVDPALLGDVPRLDEEDERFDSLYPRPCRDLSSIHWTPVRVARRATELLDLSPSCRVLDVGSGVGKFCLVASSCSDAAFVGVERRSGLVDIANAARRASGADRVEFLNMDAFQLDWSAFQALYFYNPFGDHFLAEDERIDGESTGMDDYDRAVLLTQDRLNRMPKGSKVVLYHGFGGGMPSTWEPVCSEWCGTGILQVWRKPR